MELRQLRYFIEVSRHNSFSQAAEACFITLQGISMSIIRLEDELGCKLFERSAKGVFLTKEGEYLLPRAQQIVRLSDECERHFAEGQTENREVTVVYSFGRAIGDMLRVMGSEIGRFCEEQPTVKINIFERNDSQCEADLENGIADFALCAGAVSGRFDTELLFEDRLVLNVHKDHPLAQKASVCVKDLKDVPLALQPESAKSTAMLVQFCERAGFLPTVAAYVDDTLLAMHMAECRQCCCITTRAIAESAGKTELCSIPFEDQAMRWSIYLVKKKDHVLTPQAAALEKLLLDCPKEFKQK